MDNIFSASPVNFSFVRQAFEVACHEKGLQVLPRAGAYVAVQKIDANFSLVAAHEVSSRNGRVLGACWVGIMSSFHQNIAYELSDGLQQGVLPYLPRGLVPEYFTAGDCLALGEESRTPSEITSFSLTARQCSWVYSVDSVVAQEQIEKLVAFIAEEVFPKLARYASFEHLAQVFDLFPLPPRWPLMKAVAMLDRVPDEEVEEFLERAALEQPRFFVSFYQQLRSRLGPWRRRNLGLPEDRRDYEYD